MLRKSVKVVSHSSVWDIHFIIKKFVIIFRIRGFQSSNYLRPELFKSYPFIKLICTVYIQRYGMSQESISQSKWTCEYCTYENFPNALKCTMCRGAKPLLGEDIYRLHKNEPSPTNAAGPCSNENLGKWACDFCTCINFQKNKECSECRNPRYPVTAENIHDHFRPLKINESDSCTSKAPKWSCEACTYENWPKSKKCIMCGNQAPRTSPCHSSVSLKTADNEITNVSRPQLIEENALNSIRR